MDVCVLACAWKNKFVCLCSAVALVQSAPPAGVGSASPAAGCHAIGVSISALFPGGGLRARPLHQPVASAITIHISGARASAASGGDSVSNWFPFGRRNWLSLALTGSGC